MISPTQFDRFLDAIDEGIEPQDIIDSREDEAKRDLSETIKKVIGILKEALDRRFSESTFSRKIVKEMSNSSPLLREGIEKEIDGYRKALALQAELETKIEDLTNKLGEIEKEREAFVVRFSSIERRLGDQYASPSYVAKGAETRFQEAAQTFAREKALGRKETNIGSRFSNWKGASGF